MSMDAFLKLAGVKGESKMEKDAIDIFSFSVGASNPVSMQGAGGMGAGKASVSSFNLMKKTDSSSPTLFTNCCSGKHFVKGEIILRKAAGKQVEFLRYTIEHVFVESVQWSGSSGGDDTPTESLSLAFQIISMTYTPQKEDGTPGSAVVAKWDIATAKSK